MIIHTFKFKFKENPDSTPLVSNGWSNVIWARRDNIGPPEKNVGYTVAKVIVGSMLAQFLHSCGWPNVGISGWSNVLVSGDPK